MASLILAKATTAQRFLDNQPFFAYDDEQLRKAIRWLWRVPIGERGNQSVGVNLVQASRRAFPLEPVS